MAPAPDNSLEPNPSRPSQGSCFQPGSASVLGPSTVAQKLDVATRRPTWMRSLRNSSSVPSAMPWQWYQTSEQEGSHRSSLAFHLAGAQGPDHQTKPPQSQGPENSRGSASPGKSLWLNAVCPRAHAKESRAKSVNLQSPRPPRTTPHPTTGPSPCKPQACPSPAESAGWLWDREGPSSAPHARHPRRRPDSKLLSNGSRDLFVKTAACPKIAVAQKQSESPHKAARPSLSNHKS